MKKIPALLLFFSCIPACPSLPANPPPKAPDRLAAADSGIVLEVDGKRFKLLLGNKDELMKALSEANMAAADPATVKDARKKGFHVMTECLKGRFVLVETSR